MAKRKSRKKSTNKRGLGEVIIFGLAFFLAGIAFFLEDSQGVRFRWAGSYVWLAAYLFGFTGYLFYLVQFIFPLEWRQSWFEGLRLAVPFNFPIVDRLVKASLRPSAPATTSKVKSELPQGFLTNKAGLIPSHLALAVAAGSKFSRSAGPGYIRLNASETVTQVVDLHRHMRRERVKAMTSDAVPIETVITVIFQVKHEDPPLEPKMPYPYEKGAIFWVNYLESFRSEHGAIPWGERIARQASSALVDELSNYSLNELFQQTPSIPSLVKAKTNVHNRLVTEFNRYDITIHQISMGKIELPIEVVGQRIEDWQSRWQSRIQLEEALSEAAMISEPETDRTSLLDEQIQGVLTGIERALQDGDIDLATTVIEHTYSALKAVAGDDDVRALLPGDTIVALRHFQSWAGDGS